MSDINVSSTGTSTATMTVTSTAPLTIEAPSWVVATLSQWEIQNLEGKLLTIIDAVVQGDKQCKATKNIVSNALWSTLATASKAKATYSEDGFSYEYREDKDWDGPPPPGNPNLN